MYIQHTLGLCQSMLSKEDYALSIVTPATMAVETFERPNASPPPSLSILYCIVCFGVHLV
jgi:hypothetical protein